MLVVIILVLVMGPVVILGQQNQNTSSESMVGEWTDFWIVRLSLNLFAYGTFALVGYLVIRWAKSTNYVERSGEKYYCNFN